MLAISDALADLVPFVQLIKHEKHPWRSVTFSKGALLKVTLLHGCFSLFLSCANDTKLRKTSNIFLEKVICQRSILINFN